MKKILSVLLAFSIVLSMSLMSFADVVTMPDGNEFDSEFYAALYPDVASVYGNDAESLFKHYVLFGKTEGRVASSKGLEEKSEEVIPVIYPQKVHYTQTINDGKIRKCVVAYGDSRTCSVIGTLMQDSAWKRVYYATDAVSTTTILIKDDVALLITGEAGGSIANGAYDRAVNRITPLMSTRSELINNSTVSYFSLFAINDLIVWSNKSGKQYIEKDEALIKTLPKCTAFYQFNAGPVSECGWEYQLNNNEAIESYNKAMVSTDKVTVVDLYSYLCGAGFDVVMDSADLSGVHYDEATNKKIIALIMSFV